MTFNASLTSVGKAWRSYDYNPLMCLQTEHSCRTKTYGKTQKLSAARRSTLATSAHQTQLSSVSSLFDAAGSSRVSGPGRAVCFPLSGAVIPGDALDREPGAHAARREPECPASTPGSWHRHSWRFPHEQKISTGQRPVPGTEARVAVPWWLGASPSRRVVPGFLQLPFWAPSSPAGKMITLSVSHPHFPPTTQSSLKMTWMGCRSPG